MRNLNEKETDIYNSWLEAEAEYVVNETENMRGDEIDNSEVIKKPNIQLLRDAVELIKKAKEE